MKQLIWVLLLAAISVTVSAQTAPEASPEQQESFPETQPDTMKLLSPGFTLYVNYAHDARSPQTQDVWHINIEAWSKKQVAISGHCDDKDHEGTQKMLLMTGTPGDGDSYVLLRAVIFSGHDREERDFILTWDPDDVLLD